ncbi:right-handed parallel beta-helix repeat-containing protein [Candidatus Bipolaricaulota bacterium]|nr:right-handed parallel beta-helix repeat-containing protein [Candidatus Bipolaricaulota bacterium]
MRKFVVSMVVVGLSLPVLFSLMAFGTAAHGPIVILGNADFTEENGVTAGSGTASDPYIISGWNIAVSAGSRYGLKIENTSAHVKITGVTIQGPMDPDGAAIRLGFVSNVTIDGCILSGTANGIEIASSYDVVMRQSVIQSVRRGIEVTGASLDEYRHDIDTSNELNGSPIRYLVNRNGETIRGLETSNLYVVGSRNMVIADNVFSDGDGIQLMFVQDSIVSGNVLYRGGWNGVYLYRSENNQIVDNELGNNYHAAILLALCSGNSIHRNQLLANDYGLILSASDGNDVFDNLVAANPTGIEISAGSTNNDVFDNIVYYENTVYGIAIDRATGNRVTTNAIVDSESGILLGTQANENTVRANSIIGSAYGILVDGSRNVVAENMISQSVTGLLFRFSFGQNSVLNNVFRGNLFNGSSQRHASLSTDGEGNVFYENAFLGSAIDSTLIYDPGLNRWSYDGVGNLWEDYDGLDADVDGIGDTPVLIVPAGVEDNAPAMPDAITLADPDAALSTHLGIVGTMELAELSVTTGAGEDLLLRSWIADETHERFVGFRGFPPQLIAQSPGMLFVYEQAVQGGPTGTAFTMKTVDFDLDIAFFDETGTYVGGETMLANHDGRYTVSGMFRFALELPAGSLEALEIGEGAMLHWLGAEL